MDLADGRGRHQSDAKAAGFGAHLVEEWPCRTRGDVRVAGHLAVHGVEHGRGVTHRPGNDVLVYEPAEHVAELGAQRVSPPRRLQADEAALAGGDTDGPA